MPNSKFYIPYSIFIFLLILAVVFLNLPPFWENPPETKAATQDKWFVAASGTYKYRKKLTLDNTLVSGSTDLTNFPVLVAFTDTDLKVTGSGGDVTNSSGYDIIFAEADSVPVQLDHEIELYTSTTGEIVMWVEIPTLGATADTDIYMYYGNSSISSTQESATGVWDSNYAGVWHMAEDPSISTDGDCGGGTKELCDSTSNDNDGDSAGVMTAGDLVTAKIGQGLDFDGSDDRIEIPDAASLDITGTVTLSGWFKTTTVTGDYQDIISKGDDDAANVNYAITPNNDENYFFYTVPASTYNSRETTNANFATATWYHFAVAYSDSANSVDHYVDGTLKTDVTGFGNNGETSSMAANARKLFLGWDSGTAGEQFSGVLDELRVSNSVRSADWIKTEYDNGANQGTGTGKFIKTAGSEEGYVTSTGSVDTRWVKGGATGKSVVITVDNSVNSAVTTQWIQITRPSSNYTMTAGSATGWSAAVTASTVTFTGSTIAANASTAFTVTADLGSSDEAQTAWTVDVDDGTDGATATTSVATSTTALYTGIDATAPSVSMSAVSVNSTTQLTASSSAATDASAGIHATAYWFDETSGNAGATDSTDWQAGLTFEDTGLTAGTQYCYRIKARDALLNESSFSTTVCATTTAAPVVAASTPVPTPAATPQVIKSLEIIEVNAKAADTTATITLTTTEKANVYIEYGLKDTYGSTTVRTADYATSYSTVLKDLTPSTTYHFRVNMIDVRGFKIESGDYTFQTAKLAASASTGTSTPLQPSNIPKTVEQIKEEEKKKAIEEEVKKVEEEKKKKAAIGPIITNVALAAVRPTSAKVTWQTNVPATSQIFFGEKSGELNQVTIEYATLVAEHSVVISDLKPKTTYYFVAASRNASDVQIKSSENTFITESLEIQTVIDITKPLPLPPGSPGTQTPKISAGETVTVIPILPTSGDTNPPEVILSSFAKNPTQDTSPSIRGQAKDLRGVIASVAYSTDGGSTWHPIDTINGIGSSAAQFSAKIPHLVEGEYNVLFRARDNSGNVGKSDTRALVIDIKPPKTGANIFTLGTQPIATSDRGVLSTLTGITQRIAVSAIGGATAVAVKAADAVFPLIYSKADGLWFGDITMKKPGSYQMKMVASDGAGRVSERFINNIHVTQPGTVIDAQNKEPLAQARISLFVFSKELNDFVLWPGDIFNQANPSFTGKDGSYRFIVPAGRYYIQGEKAGYQTFYTNINDLPNHAALNFILPMRKKSALTLSVPFLKQSYIPLPAVPDFFAYQRVSLPQDALMINEIMDNAFVPLIGKIAPPLSGFDSAGKPIDIRYLRGKKTILTAWSTWSPLAQIQIPILDQLVREDPNNLNILLLSIQESRGVVETYLRRGNYNLRSMIDSDGDLLDFYPITTLPQHFFLDRKGIIQKTHTGFLNKNILQDILHNIP